MIAEEFVTLLKFDVVGKDNVQKIKVNLQKVVEVSKTLTKALAGMATSVGFFADRVAKDITSNYEWAKSVGVAVDSYQRFDYAAKMVGGNLDSIKTNLEEWVRSAKASGMTLEEVFLREARSVEGMSAEQSHAILSAKNYSEESIRLLQQGESKLKETLARAGVIPEEQLIVAKEYTQTWREFQSEITLIGMQAVSKALPALREILDYIRKFLFDNKESIKNFITTFFLATVNIVKMVYRTLKPFLDVLGDIIKYVGNLKEGTKESDNAIKIFEKSLKALMAVFAASAIITFISRLGGFVSAVWSAVYAVGALSIAFFASPIGVFTLAVIAAATAVYLLYKNWDDFLYALQGIAMSPFEFLSNLVKTIETINDKLIELGETLNNPVFSVLGAIGKFEAKVGQKALDWTKDFIDNPMEKLKKSFDWVGDVKDYFSQPIGYSGLGRYEPYETTSMNGTVTLPGRTAFDSYYTDNRNITINTNATSGPAIASYLKNNDLVRSGYGTASGAW